MFDAASARKVAAISGASAATHGLSPLVIALVMRVALGLIWFRCRVGSDLTFATP